MPCDSQHEAHQKALVLQVLQFTALMIEHSFTRHLYSSMEHPITLLCSSDMTIVLTVLNLLYVFRYNINWSRCLNLCFIAFSSIFKQTVQLHNPTKRNSKASFSSTPDSHGRGKSIVKVRCYLINCTVRTCIFVSELGWKRERVRPG